MSDSAIIVAEISLPPHEAARRAPAVTEWLLSRRIIERNIQPDPLWRPSEYAAGPHAVVALPDFHRVTSIANNGVDIIKQRHVHDASSNYEPPRCPNCETTMDEDSHVYAARSDSPPRPG